MKTTADFVKAELRRQQDLPPTRGPLLEHPNWHRGALCAPSVDDDGSLSGVWDLYFPPSTRAEQKEAEGYCANCPVRRQCERAGEKESVGVWGGVPKDDRPSRAARTLTPEQQAQKSRRQSERLARLKATDPEAYRAHRDRESERKSRANRKEMAS